MQHVITVKWTSDNKYILCGSDEMNIRLWKANASEKLGVVRVHFAFCCHKARCLGFLYCYYNWLAYSASKNLFLKGKLKTIV